MRRSGVRGGAVAGALAVAVLAACASPHDVAAPGEVVVAMAEETFPSRTARDWVTWADHVVVASAVDEVETLLPVEEGDPPGMRSFGRDVTLRVDELVWSSADPRHAAPAETFVLPAPRTIARDDVRTRVAIEDTPRVEVGHTYVVALVRSPAVEDPTTPSPAHWTWLGSDALLPYDEGTIGVGELEGSVRAEPLRVPADDLQHSFEDAMAGRSAADLAAVLDRTTPGPREGYG
ncbi:hypothetical protein ACH436_06660 [Isoptericola sp. NPDC019693]|uniref:hypothetical protein n=1 Tax=Isoptericola sp. NPDC019693 TaxID=3364009 RepID=UPI0037BDD77B